MTRPLEQTATGSGGRRGTPRDAVRFFTKRFAASGDPASAAAQKAYMKSALRFHGIGAKELRAACADFATAHPLDHDALVREVDALYDSDWFDLRSAGLGVLERKRSLLGVRDREWLLGLVRRSPWWAHVDWIATKMMPRALPADPARVLRAWGRDADMWVRRTALLAQLEALRGGAGDFDLFAEIATPMLGEKEFFIRKAIGWVLRDVSRRRPELTFAYVKAHSAEMAGLTCREATRRLPEKLAAKL